MGEKNKPLGPKCCSTAVQRERERETFGQTVRGSGTPTLVCACVRWSVQICQQIRAERTTGTNKRTSVSACSEAACVTWPGWWSKPLWSVSYISATFSVNLPLGWGQETTLRCRDKQTRNRHQCRLSLSFSSISLSFPLHHIGQLICSLSLCLTSLSL